MIIKEEITTFENISEGTLEQMWNEYWDEYGGKAATPSGQKWRVYRLRSKYKQDRYGKLGGTALTGVILARQAGVPAGYIGWTDFGNWVKIQGVKVAAPFRREGLARELIVKATNKLRKIGVVIVGGMSLDAWTAIGWEEENNPDVLTSEEWDDLHRGNPVLVYNPLSSDVKDILQLNK